MGGVSIMPSPARAHQTGAPHQDDIVTKADIKAAQNFFKAVDRNRFKDALRLTRKVKNPDVVRVLMWNYITASRSPATFNDVKAFLDHHADWPQRVTLLKRAEDTMPAKMPPQDVLAWFQVMGGPVSTPGRVREAEAMMALNEPARAKAQLRQLWVENNFGKAQEKRFYRRHKKLFSKADNAIMADEA